jgi:hypothetical protein
VIEAKKKGSTLTGVEWQSAKYTTGLPDAVPALTKEAEAEFAEPSIRSGSSGRWPVATPRMAVTSTCLWT